MGATGWCRGRVGGDDSAGWPSGTLPLWGDSAGSEKDDGPIASTATSMGSEGSSASASSWVDSKDPANDASMEEVFAKTIRPKLDVIDKVRPYLADQKIDLPAIVVVGDQSSGKSSLLESISGRELYTVKYIR